MNLKEFWKRTKRILAFVVAFALFFNGWANYDFSVLAADELTVVLSASEAVYTGGDLKPSITSVKENDTDVAYTASDVAWMDANGQLVDGEIKNAGIYTVTVSVTEDVVDADGVPTGETKTRSGNAQFTVNPINLAGGTVNVAGSYTYTGAAIEPADVTVQLGGNTVDKSLYTVEFSNNVNAGNANVAVKAVAGNGNVTGEAAGTFTIAPVVFDVSWNVGDYEYDGNTLYFPPATVAGKTIDKCGEAVEIMNGVTVTLTTDATVNPGAYTAQLTLSDTTGNYKLTEGKATNSYSVGKKVLTAENVTISSDSEYADGTDKTPEIVVTANGKTLVENTDYTVTKAGEMIAAGNYDIKVSGQGNYSGEVVKTFAVDYVYDGVSDGKVVITGNTLDKAVYRGTVTLTPAQGYQSISTEEAGTYGTELVYDENTTKTAQLFLKDTSGNISKVTLPEFSFDNVAPNLEISEPANNDEWTSEKEIVIVDKTGADYGLFYTTDAEKAVPSTITSASELNGLTKLDENSLKCTAEATYYFYAVDNAGFVTAKSVTVKNIDTELPTISVTTNGAEVDKTMYSNTPVELTVTFSDEGGSKIKEDEIKFVDGEGNALTLSPTATENVYTFEYAPTATEKTNFKVDVKDNAGNPANIYEFEIYYDVDAPALQNLGLFTENEDGGWEEFSADTWINAETKDVYLRFTVTDDITDVVTSGLEKVTVTGNGNNFETEITLTPGITEYAFQVPAEEDFEGSYTVKAVDKAGNLSDITQSVKVDVHAAEFTEAPVITGTSNGLSGNDLWYNAEEITFSISATDATTGITKIVATTDANVTDLNTVTANEIVGNNTAGSNEYTFTVEDTDFQLRTYYFYAVDEAGNLSVCDQTVELRRDSQLPKTDSILLPFSATESDLLNSVSKGEENKIYGFINSIKNIFVKTQITVTFYVEDTNVNGVFSGVNALTFEYNGKLYEGELQEGYHAYVDADAEGNTDGIFDLDENVSGGYSIFSATIPVSTNDAEKIGKRINITEVKDLAGNSCPVTDEIVLADDNLIIIDDVAPELTVNYAEPNGTKDSDETYFYNAETSVDLEIKELNFSATKVDGGTEKATEVTYGSTSLITGGTGNTNGTVISVWDETAVLTDAKATAAVTVPTAGDDAEVEYTFSLKYQDPSGNFMTGDGVSETPGQSISKTLIIDTLEPELKEFKITDANDQALFTDEGLDFAQNVEGDDVKITVKIDDNANYFNEENVGLFYRDNEEGEWQSLTLNGWSHSGREHTASCTFDGAENEEHTYRFKVVYLDMAQNPMVNNGATVDAADEGGAFISTQKVVIDHSAPKMTQHKFETPVQVFDRETNEVNGTAAEDVTNADSRMYYSENGIVKFDIEDAYLKASDLTVNVQKRADKLDSFSDEISYQGDGIATKDAKDAFAFTLPKEDAEYQYTISYTDRSGNKVVYADSVETNNNVAYKDAIADGVYTSSVFVRDTVNPVISVKYTTETNAELAEYNSVKSVKALVTVTEMNLDMKETKIYVTAKDVNGKDIACKEVDTYNEKSWQDVAKNTAATRFNGILNQRSLEMTFATEANYEIKIEVVDKVTKEVSTEKTFCIDRTVPEIKIVDKNGDHPNKVVKGALVDMEKSDITYKVVNDGKFSQILNKVTFGYFSDAKIVVTVKAHDQISGVKNIVYTYADESGSSKTVTATPKLYKAGDNSCSVITFTLPISFKGQIQAFGIDNTENSAKDKPSGQIGVIAETEDKHKATSKVDLDVVTSYSKTPDFYNGDVKVKFTSMDGYSGLYMIEYTAGNDLVKEEVDYSKEGQEIVTSVIERNYTIKAATNNENNIVTGLMLEDNAGYTREIPEAELPKIHIDTTAPKVEVEYDNNDFLNEKYYKADRIATVTVTERNFDPSDVEFDITGPTASIGTWAHTAGAGCTAGSDPSDTHHSDLCRWSCTVHFSLDGDYTFGFRCVDLAGNEGKYDRVDEFTIDKTFPEITVVYDNNDFQNEYYYKEARTATITIEEHNFSANDVIVTMTAKDDGRTIAVPSVSGWSSAGDMNTATIHYNYDAEFTFDIEFMDLAGNEADDYEEDHFVVDMTAPELEIFDIENMSANNGVVRPGIRYHDTNYDKDGTVILMTGYNNGNVEMTGERKLEANGLELKLNDFEYIQEMDDIYTMEATVYDLAGNSSEAMVIFSVNRFGSVYTFDEATEALIGENGSYYTKEPQDLVITETNVDTLEFEEITMNMNGKLTTLKEGVDYTVKATGSDVTWKQYTYTIKAANFIEEGKYILTIYSEDRATNVSDNNTKGKKVEFVIDKTSPSVLISGVETDGQYRTNVQNMTIDIDDNVLVSTLKVVIDGVETIFDGTQIAEADGKIVVGVHAKNHAQNIEVTVIDAAGNAASQQLTNVRVNANAFVLFYLNKPLFFGTLGGSAALAAGLWWFLAGKKKKGEEQTK